MTIEFKDIVYGKDYTHKSLGKVTMLATHPHDGATFLIEYEAEDGDIAYTICERHDLTEVVPT